VGITNTVANGEREFLEGHKPVYLANTIPFRGHGLKQFAVLSEPHLDCDRTDGQTTNLLPKVSGDHAK
jgi:hypothetical protein